MSTKRSHLSFGKVMQKIKIIWDFITIIFNHLSSVFTTNLNSAIYLISTMFYPSLDFYFYLYNLDFAVEIQWVWFESVRSIFEARLTFDGHCFTKWIYTSSKVLLEFFCTISLLLENWSDFSKTKTDWLWKNNRFLERMNLCNRWL